jgi:hypothetical protein
MFNPKLIDRSSTAILVALILITGSALPASAASEPVPESPSDTNLTAPANDDFANALSLPGHSGSVTGTTTNATHEAAEPPHARNRGGASVWYKYVAQSAGIITFDTTNSNFDTTMAVYKGSNMINARVVGANDDTLGTASSVKVGANAGDTFYIAIDGYYNSGTGSFASGNLSLNYTFANVAANDNFANAQLLEPLFGKLITTSNVGASREPGEPIMFGNQGGRSLWYKWVAPAVSGRSYTFTFEGKTVGSNVAGTLVCGIYTGTALNNLTEKMVNNRTGVNEMTVTPTPGQTFYISVDGSFNGVSADLDSITLNYGITKAIKMADFDRDGRADITVFRPSTGTWYTIDSITDNLRSAQFGANGDLPVLMDFGFDGKPDYAVFRPGTGVWYVNDTESGVRGFAWGTAGDIPMAFHTQYDRWQAVYRPGTGGWYIYNGGDGYSFQFGAVGDRAALADSLGLGFDNLVVFRPSTGTWYISYLNVDFTSVQFGQSGDVPVMADYDGDGKADVAVFRPSTSTWYILRSSDKGVVAAQWGLAGDIPQPADYDGDGKADIAVFRSGNWYIRQSSNNAFRQVQFGQAGDIPVTTPTS